MASIHRDPSGNFHIHFRFSGLRFERSLRTRHQRRAEAAANHVEENIRLISEGMLVLPDDFDVPTYLLSAGKPAGKPKVNRDCKLGRFAHTSKPVSFVKQRHQIQGVFRLIQEQPVRVEILDSIHFQLQE